MARLLQYSCDGKKSNTIARPATGEPLFRRSRIFITPRRPQRPQSPLAGVDHSSSCFPVFVAMVAFAVRASDCRHRRSSKRLACPKSNLRIQRTQIRRYDHESSGSESGSRAQSPSESTIPLDWHRDRCRLRSRFRPRRSVIESLAFSRGTGCAPGA